MIYKFIANVLAIMGWIYGEYKWRTYGIGIGDRGHLEVSLMMFLLFVLLAGKADETLQGLSFYCRLFGLIGLFVIVYVIDLSVSRKIL